MMRKMIRKAQIKLRSLRIGLTLLLGLMLVLPVIAGDNYQEKFERIESLAKNGRVIISNVSGDIKVLVWKEEKVRIEAVKKTEASSETRAKEKMDEVKIEVKSEPGAVVIMTQYPSSKRFFGGDLNVSVDYTIWIPEAASIEARSASGDIRVENAGGTVKANVVSGNVEVYGGKKSVVTKTVSGNIKLEGTEGDCELNSVSGNLSLSRIKGSVEAEVVSGSIKLSDISQARQISIKSISGILEYRGQLVPDGRYQFSSHSGNIRLFLPADSSFELEASTFSGSVSTNFPVEVIGKIGGREIKGKVNKGGPAVAAKTFSGSVEIRKIS